MITKLNINHLRNAEYFQMMQSAIVIFDKYGIDRENLRTLYEELRQSMSEAELAFAYEETGKRYVSYHHRRHQRICANMLQKGRIPRNDYRNERVDSKIRPTADGKENQKPKQKR